MRMPLANPSRVLLTLALLASLGKALPATAQAPGTNPPATISPEERQKAALAEADHMMQLARQLRATLQKTRRDELSVQVIRQADEIEKLARSVKARIH